jgi:thiosulfate/3-mercaptopyruvate sulfurtransferase
MTTYSHPEVLVSTDWVQDNPGHASIALMEVDLDTTAYDAGHIPGAVGFNWQIQFQDQVRRDILSKEAFESLLGGAGISPNDTVVIYGDHSNWYAAHAFWLLKVYGHKDVRLMDGGRIKWLMDPDKPMTAEKPYRSPVEYKAQPPNLELRAALPQVLEASRSGRSNLLDVRSPDEFTGKILAPPGMKETAQRGGHIPGAVSIPWDSAVNRDGTLKAPEELRAIYSREKNLDPGKDTIAYCLIGERSSHTWFVLTYLLGVRNVKNYDGSWTEYGNLIGVPIEKCC